MAATIESGVLDPIAFLPPELVIKILSCLSERDLYTAACVNRLWNEFSNDWQLWLGLIKNDFPEVGIYKDKENCPPLNAAISPKA